MSIERFLLVNLAMDLALLAVAARACGAFSVRRWLASGMLAALGAALAASSPRPWLQTPLRLLPWAALAPALTRARDGRLGVMLVLTLLTVTLSAGGAAQMIDRYSPSICIALTLVGGCIPGLVYLWRHPLRDTWQVDISVRVEGRSARFTALIDTGNRLTEPLSGQPVLIAESRLLTPLYPLPGCRSIPFGGLGGSGTLPCFRPSAAWAVAGRRRRQLPEIWIAVVPGRLPGPARALAPCEFASLSI